MALADMRGKMLFELRPDLFGDFLGATELELWGLYYEERQQNQRRRGMT